MKPKVLIINPHLNFYGGAEKQITKLANHLANKDYRIAIFTTNVSMDVRSQLVDGVRILEAGNLEMLAREVNSYSRKFEICNPHNHPCELMFSYQTKPTIVWQCNEPPEEVLRGGNVDVNQRAYVNRLVNKVVVMTGYDMARFRKTYGVTPEINPPGIEYDFFSEKVKVRNTLNMKNNFVITQVGYFTWTKNQLKTLEIFSQVKKEIDEAKLVLVGYDANSTHIPYVKSVHDKIDELGLEDDVLLVDFQKPVGIRNIYGQTNVMVSPIEAQGGFLSVFEAISAGVPTIVSDTFVGSSLVEENNLGYVSKIEDFSKKILDIYSDYDKVREETLNNRVWIKDNLTWERYGQKYEKIFEELLQ